MKNVAFDFDGVIHINVTPTDEFGQRHPTNGLYCVQQNPFRKIIKLIKFYKKYDYNIYIITSRNEKSKEYVIKTLENFNLLDIFNEKNIYFTGDTYKGDKTELLDKLQINHFYDDSIYHLKSVIRQKKNNKLKNLNRFYLTIPEKNSVLRIKL
jgi:hypothetical protein